MSSHLQNLIEQRKPNHTLPQEFYDSPAMFDQDLKMLRKQWLLVDHASRIPEPGDWFTFEMGVDSYIICRADSGEVAAFHNVCRHRGSRLCLEQSGNSRLFVCPYHAWSYRLDGTVKSAREMGSDFDPADHSLVAVGVLETYGLIFLSPSGDEADARTLVEPFDDVLAFHGMANAKVATRKTYPTAANWKLVVENFLECYHCLPAHPEYSAVHSRQKLEAFGAGPGSGDPAAVERFRPRLEQWQALAASLGHPTEFSDGDADTPQMSQLGRSPIGDPAWLSETQDGTLGSTRLMGNFQQSDGGQTGCSFSPVSYVLANCDFAFMITFRPLGPTSTDVEGVWLVDADAVEGDEYDIDRLMWVWDATLEQDKTITENNQRGVSSSGYRPGPYAMSEARVDTFVNWYLRELSSA